MTRAMARKQRGLTMRIVSTILTSLKSLRRNPTRTLLTTLGIIIGIAAVITMMEIGNGSKSAIQTSLENMGANSIMVMPGSMMGPGGARQGAGAAVSLVPADADAIGENCPSVALYSPVVRGGNVQVIFGNVNWVPSNMFGVAPAYFEIRNWTIGEGRLFTNEEVDTNARVCVVGTTIVKEVFNDMSPIDCELRIGDVTFTVIGVLKSKGANMMGSDEDDVVLTPWTTMRMRVTGLKTGTASNTSSTVSDSPANASPSAAARSIPTRTTASRRTNCSTAASPSWTRSSSPPPRSRRTNRPYGKSPTSSASVTTSASSRTTTSPSATPPNSCPC